MFNTVPNYLLFSCFILALVKLAQRVSLKPQIRPVCLPQQGVSVDEVSGQECYITGEGIYFNKQISSLHVCMVKINLIVLVCGKTCLLFWQSCRFLWYSSAFCTSSTLPVSLPCNFIRYCIEKPLSQSEEIYDTRNTDSNVFG